MEVIKADVLGFCFVAANCVRHTKKQHINYGAPVVARYELYQHTALKAGVNSNRNFDKFYKFPAFL